MDDAMLMRVLRARATSPKMRSVSDIEAAALDSRARSDSLDERHRIVGSPFVSPVASTGTMFACTRCRRRTAEAGADAGGQLWGKDFDDDLSAESHFVGDKTRDMLPPRVPRRACGSISVA